jgi:hypothetical protein
VREGRIHERVCRLVNDLCEDEQEEIAARVELLEERGFALPRPHADRIESSRHSNVKKLRCRLQGKEREQHLRVFRP